MLLRDARCIAQYVRTIDGMKLIGIFDAVVGRRKHRQKNVVIARYQPGGPGGWKYLQIISLAHWRSLETMLLARTAESVPAWDAAVSRLDAVLAVLPSSDE